MAASAATITGDVWPAVVTPRAVLQVVGQTATLAMDPASVEVSTATTATATFTPARPGRPVDFQVVDGTSWTTVAEGVEDAAGSAAADLVPDTPGTMTYRAVAKAWHGARAKQTSPTDVPVTLPGAPVITTGRLPMASIGRRYLAGLTIRDDRSGTWAITAGSLPDGLRFEPSQGSVYGTPSGPRQTAPSP